MAKNITQYDLLISCPGDIQSEVEVIEQSVTRFNEQFSDSLGIAIRARYWKKSAYAQSGGKPQDLLNNQFVKDCDAAVALLWTRFGTPTDKYGSGTEEEIELMLDAGKQVFMYFSDKPIPPSQYDAHEYARVQAFREKYKNSGIFFSYSSDDELSKFFFAHLTKYFLTVNTVTELRKERVPQLILRGIDVKGKLAELFPVHEFYLNTDLDIDYYIKKVKGLYHDISEISLRLPKQDIDDNSLVGTAIHVYNTFYPPVEISEESKDFLSKFAEHFQIELPPHFFELGNLSSDPLSGNIILGVGHTLKGTEKEKLKYQLLHDLEETLHRLAKWSPIETAFSGIQCMEFALENRGTAVDEEVEVTLRVGQDYFIPIEDYPVLKNNSMDFLLNNCNMWELLGIPSTAQYMDYEASIRSVTRLSSPSIGTTPDFPFRTTDYSDEYQDTLQNIFNYAVYLDDRDYVIKVKFDYIKHHTTIAFPAPIFLKAVPDVIKYQISSQNSPDILTGEIKPTLKQD